MAEPRLVIVEGPRAGSDVVVGGPLTVGRTEEADVILPDPGISRSHARLVPGPRGLEIEDLDSSNGTFVNGERVEGSRTLRTGDEIQLGAVVLQLVGDASLTPTPVVPPPPRAEPSPQRSRPVAAAPRDEVDEWNVPALAAIVLGPLSIALIVFSSGSGFYASLPIAVCAFALGTIGRNKVDRGESARFRGVASAGRTFGIVGTILSAVVLLAVIVIGELLDANAESIQELFDEIRDEIEGQ